jgi:hypothetical protein
VSGAAAYLNFGKDDEEEKDPGLDVGADVAPEEERLMDKDSMIKIIRNAIIEHDENKMMGAAEDNLKLEEQMNKFRESIREISLPVD